MNNVFLFSGEEKFLVYKELKKRRDAFAKKYGVSNIFEHRADDIDQSRIVNDIFSGGLFVQKKLVIIFGVPKDTDASNQIPEDKYNSLEKYLMEKIESISDEVVLVFVSFSPDKRKKFYKFLSEKAGVKNFSKLKEGELKEYVKNFFGKGVIGDPEVSFLLEKVGTDLFSLNNEMNKVQAYVQANNVKITRELLDELVYSHKETNSFEVLDNLFFDREKVLKTISQLQKEGEEPMRFLGMLNWGCRISLQIMDYYQRGEKDSKKIASDMGVHPFVVTKNMKIIERLLSKKESVESFLRKFVELDYNIKTGKVNVDMLWLEIKRVVQL